MATTHEITFRRVTTLECDSDLSTAELIEYAEDSLHDSTGLWSIQIEGKEGWFTLRNQRCRLCEQDHEAFHADPVAR